MFVSGIQVTRTDYLIGVLWGAALPLLLAGRAVTAVVMGIGLLVLIWRFIQRQGWRDLLQCSRQPLAIAIYLTFAWWLLGAFFSYDPSRSAMVIVRTAVSVFICFEISRQLAERPGLVTVFSRSLLIFTLIWTSYIFLVGYVDHGLIAGLEWLHGKQRHYTQAFKVSFSVIALLLPIIIWIAVSETGWWRRLAAFLIPLSFVVLWFDGRNPSKSALVGVVAGVLLVAFMMAVRRISARQRYSLVAVLMFLGGTGAVWFLSALPQLPYDGMKLPEIALPFPDMHRQVIWGHVWSVFKANPLFGVGVDTVNLLPASKEKMDFMIGVEFKHIEVLPSHPHSWVLEVLSETGGPGFIGAAALILLLIGSLGRNLGTSKVSAIAAIALTGVFWGSSLGNFSIWSSWWQLSYALTLGILISRLVHVRRQ